MSQPPNPYAPPSLEADHEPVALGGATYGLRREGGLVVIPVLGAQFPDRCVVCNQPAARRLRRKLYWHPQGYYMLIFVGALIYVIAALIVRKSATFDMCLCEAHAKRRQTGILLGWVGFPACVLGLIAFGGESGVLVLAFVLGLIGFPVAAIIMTQVISARRIDTRHAWLKVGQPFLDSL